MDLYIEDLMNLFETDSQEICIWDNENDELLFSGIYADMPDKFRNWSILGIDDITEGSCALTIYVDSNSEI